MAKREAQRYRCHHADKTSFGEVITSDTGVNPYVDVDATSAEEAARIAAAQTGCPVIDTTRLDDAPRTARKPRQVRPKIVLITGAALLAAQLAGCGGGSDDDRASIDPPNCAASAGVCK